MKKYILFFIIPVIALNIFFSCAEDENEKDKDAPEILDVKINWDDTIMYNGTIYKVNVSEAREQNSADPDTIITGRRIKFSARFRDDRGLSTYMIKMYNTDGLLSGSIVDKYFTSCQRLSYHNNSMGEQKDTVLCMIDTWSSRIYGHKDTLETQSDLVIRATYPKSVLQADSTRITKDVEVRMGNYNFDIHCVDRSGKETVERNHKIFIVSRDSFANIRGF